MLKSGGRCLATFFLLNEEQQTLAAEGQNELSFSFGEGVCRYVYEHSPESAAAYEETYVLNLLRERGLILKGAVRYGRWAGRVERTILPGHSWLIEKT